MQHQPWYIPKSERKGSPSGWTWCGTLRWYSMGTLRHPFHTLAPQSFYSTTPTPPPAAFHHSRPKQSAMFLPKMLHSQDFRVWGSFVANLSSILFFQTIFLIMPPFFGPRCCPLDRRHGSHLLDHPVLCQKKMIDGSHRHRLIDS